jgi:hypothetical protein
MMERTCKIEDCSRTDIKGYGWCGMHWMRWRHTGDPLVVRKVLVPKGTLCSVAGCGKPYRCKGFCGTHYRRSRTHGDALADIKTKDGSGYINTQGYRTLHRPGHPTADRRGNLLEHRMVMSDLLGRPLYDDENVHHINGVRDDNRPEYLELWSSSQPAGQRVEDKLAWAREIIARYDTMA